MHNDRPQGEQRGDAPGAGNKENALREQQAIAAALMIGEEMRRSDRSDTYVLTQRLGIFCAAMAVVGLVLLFGFARLAGDEFNPFPYMIVLGVVAAASIVAIYWGYTEARRHSS